MFREMGLQVRVGCLGNLLKKVRVQIMRVAYSLEEEGLLRLGEFNLIMVRRIQHQFLFRLKNQALLKRQVFIYNQILIKYVFYRLIKMKYSKTHCLDKLHQCKIKIQELYLEDLVHKINQKQIVLVSLIKKRMLNHQNLNLEDLALKIYQVDKQIINLHQEHFLEKIQHLQLQEIHFSVVNQLNQRKMINLKLLQVYLVEISHYLKTKIRQEI